MKIFHFDFCAGPGRPTSLLKASPYKYRALWLPPTGDVWPADITPERPPQKRLLEGGAPRGARAGTKVLWRRGVATSPEAGGQVGVVPVAVSRAWHPGAPRGGGCVGLR